MNRTQEEWLERDKHFLKWVGDRIESASWRYAIVVAQTGTGLKWVKYYPCSGARSERLIYSHGNFYGESREESIESCESAVLQILKSQEVYQ